jgi:hypothetical protein
MSSLRDMTTDELLAEVGQRLAPEELGAREVCPKCGEALVTTMPDGGVVHHRSDKPHACWDRQVKFLSGYGPLQPNEYVFSCNCEEAHCHGFQVVRGSGYTQHHVGEWSEEERIADLLRETAKRLAEAVAPS